MLNENGITDEQQDNINDLSIRITNRLIEMGYVPDCTDTNNEDEFDVQDAIREILVEDTKQLDITKVSTTNYHILKYKGFEYEVSHSDDENIGIEIKTLDGGKVTAKLYEIVEEYFGGNK
jgi:hypothetical protein